MMHDDEQASRPQAEEPTAVAAEGEAAPVRLAAEPSARDSRMEAPAALDAVGGERLLDARPPTGIVARARFSAFVALALLVHAAILAAFLWRDSHTPLQVARADETPVEVIVEPPPEPNPPEPPKPPPPKPPEPPKPKEDLRPALSAPRAPNEDTLKTERTQEKTSVPKAAQPPSEGQPQPTAQAAPPKEAAPPQDKEDAAAKEEDKSKPDAEALDKAKPKIAKQAQTKAAKPAPKQKKAPDLMASLAGSSALPELSFAKPTPKSKVYGGTEDVRWMSTVEGMLEAKVGQLPRAAHFQEGGQVLICFHVDVSGRVTLKEYCRRSGYPDVDALAMRALLAAAPFPPPPPGIERGLVWSSVFDGQLPHVHITKR